MQLPQPRAKQLSVLLGCSKPLNKVCTGLTTLSTMQARCMLCQCISSHMMQQTKTAWPDTACSGSMRCVYHCHTVSCWSCTQAANMQPGTTHYTTGVSQGPKDQPGAMLGYVVISSNKQAKGCQTYPTRRQLYCHAQRKQRSSSSMHYLKAKCSGDPNGS
jgi:hypothetical protein